MVKVLPEWNGAIVGAMHRIGMTSQGLAYQMGVNRRYISRILNSDRQTDYVRSNVESAIRSFMSERGIEDETILPQRQPESTDLGETDCPW